MNQVPFNLQPTLTTQHYKLEPLKESDFDLVYSVASDPEVWADHPNKNRWQKDVFINFFEGAIKSGGGFKVVDTDTDSVIGCTRFYDYNREENSILIGYTFYAKSYWGTGANPAVKTAMLNYAFQYVDKVILHIGATNYRSQVSIERLGAKKIDEIEIAYYGEPIKRNFVYEFTRSTLGVR